MLISELFPNDTIGIPTSKTPLPELSRVAPKHKPFLTRLARMHQISGLEYDTKKHQWLIDQPKQDIDPFVNDALHMTGREDSPLIVSEDSVDLSTDKDHLATTWIQQLLKNKTYSDRAIVHTVAGALQKKLGMYHHQAIILVAQKLKSFGHDLDEADISNLNELHDIEEHIVKHGSGYRLLSKKAEI